MISPLRVYTSLPALRRDGQDVVVAFTAAVCVYVRRYIISVDTVVLVYTRSLPICENFKVVFS